VAEIRRKSGPPQADSSSMPCCLGCQACSQFAICIVTIGQPPTLPRHCKMLLEGTLIRIVEIGSTNTRAGGRHFRQEETGKLIKMWHAPRRAADPDACDTCPRWGRRSARARACGHLGPQHQLLPYWLANS
jgi:hypothetical protein